jgi:uncharacterized protein YraI
MTASKATQGACAKLRNHPCVPRTNLGRIRVKTLKPLAIAVWAGMAAVIIALGVSSAAAATSAVAVTRVNMRAGPSTNYPVVVTLPSGTALSLYGCTADTAWCDVGWGRDRGWIAASYVQVVYRGSNAILTPAIAPVIGLTVVVFNQAYWNTHYVGRPWYSQWNVYYRSYRPPSRGVVGCGENGCGAAVTRPGQVRAGHCSDGTCTGTAVDRGPGGRVWVRRGSVSRD